MKISFLTIFIALLTQCFSQTAAPFLKKNGKYILVDSASMTPVNNNEYDEVEILKSKLNHVRTGKKWGFVDSKGNELIRPVFDDTYHGDPATVIINGKQGLVDTNGKIIVEPAYEAINSFHEGLAAVQRNQKWGFIDLLGKEAVPIKYDVVDEFHEGVASVKVWGKWNAQKHGIVNKEGLELIPPTTKYYIVWPKSEGLISVCGAGGCGFIDSTGKEVLPLKYESVGFFTYGLATVLVKNKWGVINKKGEMLLGPKYDAAEIHERFIIIRIKDKWGIIDKNGNELLPCKYDWIGLISDEGNRLVESEGKYGLINSEGRLAVPEKYAKMSAFSNDLAAVSENSKWGFIDSIGKVVVPLIYDTVFSFSDQRAWFKSNEKFGLLDLKGNHIIPPKYDEAMPFKEGMARVKYQGLWGFIDINGNEIIPPQYTRRTVDFESGFAWTIKEFMEEGKSIHRFHFLIDKAGREYREK